MTLAREFGPLAIKAVRAEFIKGGLSRSEINKRARRIVRLFKWAVAEEMVAPNVDNECSVMRRGCAFPVRSFAFRSS